MITVNPDAFNATNANSLISFIQSEKNIVGTTTPEELLVFSVSLVIAYVAGIVPAGLLLVPCGPSRLRGCAFEGKAR